MKPSERTKEEGGEKWVGREGRNERVGGKERKGKRNGREGGNERGVGRYM